jgi:C-terminal processing protease CtpA/Prc
MLALVLAGPLAATSASAGSTPPKGYKCNYDTQTCLNMMAAELKSRGWIGINYDEETFLLEKVVDGSPADAADMRVGDKLVSVNDNKFSPDVNPFEKVRAQMVPGTKLNFVILRKGKPLRVTVKLAEIPPDIRAQILGLHMMEHAKTNDVADAKP